MLEQAGSRPIEQSTTKLSLRPLQVSLSRFTVLDTVEPDSEVGSLGKFLSKGSDPEALERGGCSRGGAAQEAECAEVLCDKVGSGQVQLGIQWRVHSLLPKGDQGTPGLSRRPPGHRDCPTTLPQRGAVGQAEYDWFAKEELGGRGGDANHRGEKGLSTK